MGLKVCKFGGTSMADGNTILRGAEIIKADAERRYVVVSAPGKRFSGDIKVTDLLYKCAAKHLRLDLIQACLDTDVHTKLCLNINEANTDFFKRFRKRRQVLCFQCIRAFV